MTAKHLLMAAPAAGGGGGTPSVDSSVELKSGDASAGSWPITIPTLTNGMVLVAFADFGNTTLSNVVIGASSLTLLGSKVVSAFSAGGRATWIYYLLDPSPGATTLDFDGSQAAFIATVVYLSDVNQSTPFGTPASAAATTGTSTSLSPSGSASDLWIDSLSMRSTSADPTADGGQTVLQQGSVPSGNIRSGVSTKTSTGLGWSWPASDDYAHIAVPIKGA